MEYWWIFWTGGYSLALLGIAFLWAKIARDYPRQHHFPAVSVIIPARNESRHLPRLLGSLINQSYSGQIEIIVIDDHSEDATAEVADSYLKKWAGDSQVLKLTDQNLGGGKKAAIATGVDIANGDCIVTTDADCWMETEWLSSLVGGFHDPQIQLVFGPVTYPDRTFWERWQALEFWSLISIGAVTWKMKVPSMCNGANLAFRKAAFHAVGGYSGSINIASGDDEFLLHAIVDRFGVSSVQFVKEKAALVRTSPSPTILDFIEQRRRWASKWNLHKKLAPKLTAMLVFGFHLGWWLGIILGCTGYIPIGLLGLGLMSKLLAEGILLWSFSKTYELKFPVLEFLIWQFLYSAYAVGIGLLVQKRSYHWKGRKY